MRRRAEAAGDPFIPQSHTIYYLCCGLRSPKGLTCPFLLPIKRPMADGNKQGGLGSGTSAHAARPWLKEEKPMHIESKEGVNSLRMYRTGAVVLTGVGSLLAACSGAEEQGPLDSVSSGMLSLRT